MAVSDERSNTASASSKRSTPQSDLFTQMEPLFPQYTDLHDGQRPLRAVVERVHESSTRTVTHSAFEPPSTSGSHKDNSHSLEVRFAVPKTTIKCESRSIPRNRNHVTAPTIEVTFTQPVQTSSNVTALPTPSREETNGWPQGPAGIENVQLLKAEGQPSPPLIEPVEKATLLGAEAPRSGSRSSVVAQQGRSPPSDNFREQHQENDLSYRTTTTNSNIPGRSGYSAHRERLRQERERELILKQQQKRQLAASSTGLNEHFQHQSRQQQQQQQHYRSLSAVNTSASGEAVEEIETVVLQFIGRGVQDVDSRVGSLTTLPRGRGGSMMDGTTHSRGRVRTAFSPPRTALHRTHTVSAGKHPAHLPPTGHTSRARSTSPSVTSYNPIVPTKPPHPFQPQSPVDSRYKSFLTNASTPTKELVGISEAFDTHMHIDSVHRGDTRMSPIESLHEKSPTEELTERASSRAAIVDDSEFAVLGSETSVIEERRRNHSRLSNIPESSGPRVSWTEANHVAHEGPSNGSDRSRAAIPPKVPVHRSSKVSSTPPVANSHSSSKLKQTRGSSPLCDIARLTDPLEVDVSLTDTRPYGAGDTACAQIHKFVHRPLISGTELVDSEFSMVRHTATTSTVTPPLQSEVKNGTILTLSQPESHANRVTLEETQLVTDSSNDASPQQVQTLDQNQRSGLTKRGFSSTQFLTRNNSNGELIRPTPLHQSQTMISPTVQPLQNSRFNTSATLVNNSQTATLVNGSRGQSSTASSTIIPATPTPVMTNGWKTEGTAKYTVMDKITDNGNLGIVQDTAPNWYRPKLSREAAINILRQQPPGNFLIRDSTTFKGAYGLAVKVATLPPKVTQKTDDLQSELVRHYLIEVVNTPMRGVRLKGFASEPVFPSLAALIHQHTIDPLALPCRLILPPVPTNLPSSGSAALPPLVIGTVAGHGSTMADGAIPDNVTVASSGSVAGAPPSEVGSLHTEGPGSTTQRVDGIATIPIQVHDNPVPSHNVPYVCVVREGSSPQRRSPLDIAGSQGLTFRCLMLGSVDTPQWSNELCFARAVDQLIPLTLLTSSECDHGVSRVRYTEVQLHVSTHDGITIIDLQRRLFLRRHLPNHILLYCGLESRKKEFSHPEHQIQGIAHPKIFGIVVRKGISECTTHVFSELDRAYTAEYIVQHIRSTYPHMNVR